MTAPSVLSLHLYPVKSGAAIDVMAARVEPEGLAGDRRMMVTDASGECLTARRLPGLLTIRCMFDGDEVILRAPGMPPMVFARSVMSEAGHDARIWGNDVVVLDAGEAVAGWLSAFLGHPCRLAVKGAATRRELEIGAGGGTVSFADTAPLLLIGEQSLVALNDYIARPVPMTRFRPNIVVAGSESFDEDGWGVIRIGAVEFELAGPCDRCVITTFDPGTGAADEAREPLATLVRRRRGEDGKPYFGQFLIPRGAGRIFAGDRVEVLERKPPVVVVTPPHEPKYVHRPTDASVAAKASGPVPMICTAVIEEAEDFKTFRFKPEDGRWTDYRPGQFITLLFDVDGEAVRRNYTISSTPSRPGILSVTVKRVAGGRMSNWLHDNLVPGSRLKAQGPNGRFHLDARGSATKLLFLSAGSGVTPMISMLRYVADHDLPLDIHYHHCARRAADVPFLPELADLARRMQGRLVVSFSLTGEKDAELPGRFAVMHGRLSASGLAEACPDIATRALFCCGPDGFRRLARDVHADLAPDAVFLEESFGAEGAGDAPIEPAPYQVHFTKSDIRADGMGPATLLEIARQNGIPLSANCEAGLCGTCRCRIDTGDWVMAPHCIDRDRSVLGEDEKRDGTVLACTTIPVGAVSVSL
jgi:uncharacterized protein YcbX/ferredoxin-NADP reductase